MNQIKSTYLPELSAQLSARFITPAATAAIVFSLGAFSAPAWALGLSKITVKSHIGEPLHAEVQVIALKPQEEESLTARISDPSTFSSTGMRYSNALSGARVTVEKRGGSTYLKIRGHKAVQEPFMDLVLNVRSAKGALVRGYTMLIDPITHPARVTPAIPAQATQLQTTAPSAAASPAVVAATPPQPVPAQRSPSVMYLDDGSVLNLVTGNIQAAAQPPQAGFGQPAYAGTTAQPKRKTRKRRSRRSAIGKKTLGQDVRVVRGDTASELAVRNARAAGVSLDQMLAAMLQENADAFINGDINRLKAGVVLNMPTQNAAQAIGRTEARQILASSSNFRSYRRRLASSDAVAKTPAQERKTSGKVTSAVTDRSEAATQDRLTLARTTAEVGKASTGKPSKEETAAASSQQKNAETRVAELEKNIQDIQKLQQLSQTATQAPASAAVPSEATQDSESEIPGIKVPVTGDIVKAEIADDTLPTAEFPEQVAELSADEASAIGAETSDADMPPVITPAEAAVEQAKEAVQDALPKIETPPVEVNLPEPQTPTVAEKGMMGKLMDNIVPIGGGLAALLLGGGLVAYVRRRKQQQDEEDSAFIESRIGPDSFFDASGGQSIDTASRADGVVSSSMVYSPSQLDAGGDVDPVAEADVYLAYNRDVQAEEILKEAMRITPSRVAIYVKLMEIYAQRGDVKAFDVVAREAHHLTGGQGDEWEKAAELGMKTDPENPLYQSSGSGGMVGSLNDNWEDKPAPFATATAPMAIDPMTTNSGPAELSAAETPVTDGMDLDLGGAFDAFEQPEASGSTPLEVPADMAYTEASLSGGAPLASPSGSVPIAAEAARSDSTDLNFDLSAEMGDADQDLLTDGFSSAATRPLTTDLSTGGGAGDGISLDLADQTGNSTLGIDFDGGATTAQDGVPSVLDFSDSDTAASLLSPESTGDDTSLETKMMLAEEFRTLGDADGARMMAQEVADNASGALKQQAEQFISSL